MIVKSVALLGHKDHGKSTLIGSMLMQTGAATQARIREAEMYSKRMHKPFEPAFILDSFAEERLGEMTFDTTRAEIKHNGLAFALIDVPGHEELIKNMISGASYGEIALLLVSAKQDEGVRDQTKRHLFISRMLGIDRLIVAVNKMDTVGYSQERFEDVERELSRFIFKIGFAKQNVHFVPISAYKGENLVKKSQKIKWYRGRPLIDVLYDEARKGGKKHEGALRIITQGTISGDKGELIVGRVVNGSVSVGERISVLPLGSNATVEGIVVKGKKVRTGVIGENVALALDRVIDGELRGSVIASSANKPELKDKIKLKIFVTGRFGKRTLARFNGTEIACKSVKILHDIDTTTGEIVRTKKAKPLEAVEAEVRLVRKVPVESYDVTRELGRFVLYSDSKFAGIGTLD
jgi:translation elongation factor EF-1alpha